MLRNSQIVSHSFFTLTVLLIHEGCRQLGLIRLPKCMNFFADPNLQQLITDSNLCFADCGTTLGVSIIEAVDRPLRTRASSFPTYLIPKLFFADCMQQNEEAAQSVHQSMNKQLQFRCDEHALH